MNRLFMTSLPKGKALFGAFFLASGYLKVEKVDFLEESGRTFYSLSLTNKEVRIMFENMIHGWLQIMTVIITIL